MPLVARTSRSGLARYCSGYLLSAGLVLLGSYLTLHGDPARPPDAALHQVFSTHLLYEVGLLLVIFFLYRFRREEEVPAILAGVLGLFVMDGMLLQRRYGWDTGTGLDAGALGASSGVLFLLLAALALEVPLRSRLVGTCLASILFIRFAPGLLIEPTSDQVMDPRYVAIGWLFAACFVPLLVLPPAARGRSRLPLATLDFAGTSLALTLAGLHFVTAGHSLDLGFRVAYLAPAILVLGVVIERTRSDPFERPGIDLAVRAFPWLALALAASQFPPGLLDTAWAQSWPLTPFYLCLLALIGMELSRAVHGRDRRHLDRALLLGALACLGGDFPEMLANALYPSAWQAIAVGLLGGAACLGTGGALEALARLMAPSVVVASWLARPHFSIQYDLFVRKDLPPESLGYPWLVAYVVVLGVGLLVLERTARWSLRPLPRLGVVTTVASLPAIAFLLEYGEVVRLAIAAAVIATMLLVGLVARDGLFRLVGGAALVVGVISYPLQLQRYGEIAAGTLVMQIGFLVLLLAFLDTLIGGRVRERWQAWWDEEVRAYRRPRRRAVSS